MEIKFYIILQLFIALGCYLLAFLTARNKQKNSFNIVWLLLCLATANWNLGFYVCISPKTGYNLSLLASRFWHANQILVPCLVLHLALLLKGMTAKKKKILFLWYSLCALLSILSFTSLIIPETTPELSLRHYPVAGRWYMIYMSAFSLCFVESILLLLQCRRESYGNRRNQIRYFLIAALMGLAGGMSYAPPAVGYPLFPYLSLLTALSLAVITYASIRCRLMDIRLILAFCGLFILLYSVIIGVPFAIAVYFKPQLAEFMGSNWLLLPLALMGVLSTAGPFLYLFLMHRAENGLLKVQKRYHDTLTQAAIGMTRIRDLEKLLNLITHILTKTVHISYSAIYLYTGNGKFSLRSRRPSLETPINILTADNPLIKHLEQNREPLVYEDICPRGQKSGTNSDKVGECMMQISAQVVVPSFLEHKFIGFLALGNKLSGDIYTEQDLNVLQIMASQAALAIENAEFYQEALEMQTRIAQAEKMATIGTMADGLSHQINNRFHSLSMIAGDALDTINITDISSCNQDVKDNVSQIVFALNRIQANVIQGGEIVRGLMKYSRKQEPGTKQVSLNTLIDSTLEMIRYKVKLPEVDLVREVPDNLPCLVGNQAQLEEVLFNCIDNGFEAILERKMLLKEPGYRGKIKIMAESVLQPRPIVKITITDNGIGVKEENSKKMFTPFFTTKTMLRKGTGLGLYVIRRIVTELHHGKIAFDSEYGKGTCFTLELPAQPLG